MFLHSEGVKVTYALAADEEELPGEDEPAISASEDEVLKTSASCSYD